MVQHIVQQFRHALNSKFDAPVALRIVWSMFWRSALVGGLLAAVLSFILPKGALQAKIDALQAASKGASLETRMEQLGALMAETSTLSAEYLYFVFKQYLPVVLAAMIVARFVFRKRYKHFQLRPTKDDGSVQELDWEEGMKIGLVTLLVPFVLMALQIVLSGVFGPATASSPLALMVSVMVGLFVLFFSAHLALHWHYRHFRIVVERTEA